ncbi:MAG TPA: hypothetical protein VFY28_02545 [Candidatus Paceibacterota bacterium]|nr:hypothetical protein [Candidatus Paceibacterota bacterium]
MALLQRPVWEWCARGAVAFAFLYPPLSALTDPYSWIGYFPGFLLDAVAPSEMLLLYAFGVLQVLLAVLILFMARPWLPSLAAAVVLVAIVAASPSQFPILFRDLSLALAALALALYHRPQGYA